MKNPTSRKFTYRGRVWNRLTAINEGRLYVHNRKICCLSQSINTTKFFVLNIEIATPRKNARNLLQISGTTEISDIPE